MNLPNQISLEKAATALFPAYGLKTFPTEGHLQAYCFKWWNVYFRTRSVLYSVPNGGTRHPVEVMGMIAQGLKKGVSDLHLLLPGQVILFIEMKNGPKKLDPEQELFKSKVERMGFVYFKCCNFLQFACLMLAVFDAKVEDCPLICDQLSPA